MTFKVLEESNSIYRNGEKGFAFQNGAGLRIPRMFTPETGRESAEKFCILLNAHYDEAVSLATNYYAAIQQNNERVSRGEAGKNWPAFNSVMKFLNRLQKESGIIDS